MPDNLIELSLPCDLCGQKPRGDECYSNEEALIICPTCKRKLEEMPERAKEKLIDYLIGNVI